MNYFEIGDFAFFCPNHQNLYALPSLYNSLLLYSVVVSTQAFGSDIAGSNPVFGHFLTSLQSS